MEEGLRATVLKVEGEYLHFGWVKKNTHFGCHAVFRSESSSILYDVLLFSQPLLQVNTLTQHLAHSLTLYRALNSKIVTPVLAVLDRGEALFVVSRACEHSLGDLVRSR